MLEDVEGRRGGSSSFYSSTSGDLIVPSSVLSPAVTESTVHCNNSAVNMRFVENGNVIKQDEQGRDVASGSGDNANDVTSNCRQHATYLSNCKLVGKYKHLNGTVLNKNINVQIKSSTVANDVINTSESSIHHNHSRGSSLDGGNGVQPLTDVSNTHSKVSEGNDKYNQPHKMSLKEWSSKGKSKPDVGVSTCDILCNSSKGVYTKADRDILLSNGHLTKDVARVGDNQIPQPREPSSLHEDSCKLSQDIQCRAAGVSSIPSGDTNSILRCESDYSPIWKYSSRLPLRNSPSPSDIDTKCVVRDKNEVIYETVYPTETVGDADLSFSKCVTPTGDLRLDQGNQAAPPPLPPRTKSLIKATSKGSSSSGHRPLERCMALPLCTKKRNILGPPLNRLTKPNDLCKETELKITDTPSKDNITQQMQSESLNTTPSTDNSMDHENDKATEVILHNKPILRDDFEGNNCVSRTSSGGESIHSEQSVRPKQCHVYNGVLEHRPSCREDSFSYDIVDLDEEVNGSLSSLGSSVSVGCLDNRFEPGYCGGGVAKNDNDKVSSTPYLCSDPGSVCSDGYEETTCEVHVANATICEEKSTNGGNGGGSSITTTSTATDHDVTPVNCSSKHQIGEVSSSVLSTIDDIKNRADNSVIADSNCCLDSNVGTRVCCSSCGIDVTNVPDNSTSRQNKDIDITRELASQLHEGDGCSSICSKCSNKSSMIVKNVEDIVRRLSNCLETDIQYHEEGCELGLSTEDSLTRSPSPRLSDTPNRLMSDSSNVQNSEASTRQLSEASTRHLSESSNHLSESSNQPQSDSYNRPLSHNTSYDSSARYSDSFPGPEPYWGPEREGHIHGGSESTCMVASLASSTSSSVFASPTVEKKNLLDVEDLLPNNLCTFDDAKVLSSVASCVPFLPSNACSSTVEETNTNKSYIPLVHPSLFVSNNDITVDTPQHVISSEPSSDVDQTSISNCNNNSSTSNNPLALAGGNVSTEDVSVKPKIPRCFGKADKCLGNDASFGSAGEGVTAAPPAVPPHRPSHKLLKNLVQTGFPPTFQFCPTTSTSSVTLPHQMKPLPPERTTSERRGDLRFPEQDDRALKEARRKSDNVCSTTPNEGSCASYTAVAAAGGGSAHDTTTPLHPPAAGGAGGGRGSTGTNGTEFNTPPYHPKLSRKIDSSSGSSGELLRERQL